MVDRSYDGVAFLGEVLKTMAAVEENLNLCKAIYFPELTPVKAERADLSQKFECVLREFEKRKNAYQQLLKVVEEMYQKISEAEFDLPKKEDLIFQLSHRIASQILDMNTQEVKFDNLLVKLKNRSIWFRYIWGIDAHDIDALLAEGLLAHGLVTKMSENLNQFKLAVVPSKSKVDVFVRPEHRVTGNNVRAVGAKKRFFEHFHYNSTPQTVIFSSAAVVKIVGHAQRWGLFNAFKTRNMPSSYRHRLVEARLHGVCGKKNKQGLRVAELAFETQTVKAQLRSDSTPATVLQGFQKTHEMKALQAEIKHADNDSVDEVFIYGAIVADSVANATLSSASSSYHRKPCSLKGDVLKQFQQGKELNIQAIGGKVYQFSCQNNRPKAELSVAEHDGDQLQLARTIVNMMDNVGAKSGVVEVDTQNEFVAAITQCYLNKLKKQGITGQVKLKGKTYRYDGAECQNTIDLIMNEVSQTPMTADGVSWEKEVRKTISSQESTEISVAAIAF